MLPRPVSRAKAGKIRAAGWVVSRCAGRADRTRCARGARFGAAHAPSPDVRCGHPALRSLDADCAPASCLRLSATPALGTWAAPHGFRRAHNAPALGPEGRVSTSGRRPAKRRSAGCRAVACIQPMGSPSRMHRCHYGVASRSPSAWRRIARSSEASLRERFFSCIAIRGFFLSSCSWRARKSQ